MSSDITPQFSDAMRLIYAGWLIGTGVLLVLCCIVAYVLDYLEANLTEDER